MSITGDNSIFGQTQNITGDNTALYGNVSTDVLNVTDAITFQEYGSGDSGVDSNYISFNNSLNTGVFNNKLSSGTFEFDMNGTTALAITNNSVGLKNSGGTMTYLTNQNIIDTISASPYPLLSSNNTWTNINTFDSSGCTIRSSWATGGIGLGLYRNISEILTPLNYDVTEQTFTFAPEVNPSIVLSLDFSNNRVDNTFDLNNFYYDVDIGRNLTVDGNVILNNTYSTVRSSWATAGLLGLYRNISEILTPLDYNVDAKTFYFYDEILGPKFVLDTSGNRLTSSLDLNNFYYDVDIGRSLGVSLDVDIGRDLTVSFGTTALKNNILLAGNMDFPSPLSLATTTSIGLNTLTSCPATAYANEMTCIGSGVMPLNTSAAIGTVAVGRQVFGQATNLGSNNVGIGYRAGYNITSGNCSNCVFIGANTGVSNVTFGFTNSIAIGNGAQITATGQVVIGAAGLLTVVPGNLQIQQKFVERASGTIWSAAFNVVAVIFTYYSINSVTPFSITLPAAINTYLGVRITFRRVAGDPLNAITSASANIYAMDSNTPDNEILPPNVYSCTLVCLIISSGVFGWFRIDTNENTNAVELTGNQTSITGYKVFRSLTPLAGNMTVPAVSSISTVSIGQSSLLLCNADAAQRALVSIGYNCFSSQTASFQNCVGVGANVFTSSSSLGNNNTAIGGSAGSLWLQTGSNNTLIGANTDFDGNSAHSNSTAIGAGATIFASNQCVLATAAETVYVPGRFQVKNSYIASASPTLITGATTLSGVLYKYYSISPSATFSITLPVASIDYLGVELVFRRVSGGSQAITSASSNIYPVNSITVSNEILNVGECQKNIVCMILTASTYGWFAISQT